VSDSGWDDIAHALARYSPARVAAAAARAAVALVLREGSGGRELLLIRRAEHERDPWSGQVGFPGGRSEPEDVSLEATAVRETREETGIELLGQGRLLGRLDELRALARGRPVDLVITPFVYALQAGGHGAPSHEVVSLHWLSLQSLLDPAARSFLDHVHEGVPVRLPCLRVGGLVLWGLSYRMFENLRAVVAEPA
jgi:8-oxo-dGTP pyrophosphatase MutT (NUDIX family)